MRVLAVALLVLLAGCTAPHPGQGAPRDADAPTPEPPAPDPPAEGRVALTLGDAWTYAVTSPRGNGTQTARVSDVRDGSAFVDTDGERPLRTELDQRTLAIRSVTQSGGAVGGSATFDPPLAVVVPAADHEWIGAITLRTPLGASSQAGRATVTFLGLERVSVPAGDLACYHYHLDLASEGSPAFRQALDVWYSPEAKAYAKQVSRNETQALVSYRVSS